MVCSSEIRAAELHAVYCSRSEENGRDQSLRYSAEHREDAANGARNVGNLPSALVHAYRDGCIRRGDAYQRRNDA